MSDLGLPMTPEDSPVAPKRPWRRGRSWVAVVLSISVLVVIGLGVRAAIGLIPSFGDAEDYVGDGSGSVEVEVVTGQSLSEIGQTLKKAGVVASVEAWVDATQANSRSGSIAPGRYAMRTGMSAQSALVLMLEPSTRITDKLLLREGLRLWESVGVINDSTGLSKARLTKVATTNGTAIGLPRYARDNAEGFLFPATYELPKDLTATEVISTLVARWEDAAGEVNLTANAKKIGRTPYEIMIIASLIQAEGHPDDFAKVSRVIYNRLDPDTWGGTAGFLQMDATVNYALKSSEINLTTEQLTGTKSRFNTYLHVGLPPTPINSPGQAAMEAALNPADGPWLYYVTVNPDSGQTKFTDDYDEFLGFRNELSEWYKSNPQ